MSARRPSGEIPTLAAVVISRNEERFIGSTLEAVLAATAGFGDCDVVLVDSCSTDRTLEIARDYPVRIVELRDSPALCAAIGRVVGQRLTRSTYVLFVDGDTLIDGAWLRQAVALLDAQPNVAGVSGKLPEVHYEGDIVVGGLEDVFANGEETRRTDQLGGNAVYRRGALEEVGSFNPYIRSYEEAELGARLQKKGYHLLRIPVALGTHRSGVRGSVQELRRRFRDNLIVGYGQTLRVSIPDGLFWTLARAMNRYLMYDSMLVVGAVTAIGSLVTGRGVFFLAWLGLAAAVVVAFMVRSRSIRKPFRLILDWSFWAIPLVVGFVQSPWNPLADGVESVIARQYDGASGRERARDAAEAR